MNISLFQALFAILTIITQLSAADCRDDWQQYARNPHTQASQTILQRLASKEHVGALRVVTEEAITKLQQEYAATEAKLNAEKSKYDTHQSVDMRITNQLLRRLGRLSEELVDAQCELDALSQYLTNSIRPTLGLDVFLRPDAEGIPPHPIPANRPSQRSKLQSFVAVVTRQHRDWLESLQKVQNLPVVSASAQNMRNNVVAAMRAESNRLAGLTTFLQGNTPIRDKLARRTQYSVVDNCAALAAMDPTLHAVVSGSMDELQKLRSKIFAILWQYNDMLEPSAYYNRVARQFIELHDQTTGVNEYERLKGRLGSLIMAQSWLRRYYQTVDGDDISYDPSTMLDAVQDRMDQYRIWFINRQASDYRWLFAGRGLPQLVKNFIEIGEQFIQSTKNMNKNGLVNWLNNQTCFVRWNAHQNFFHDHQYNQTFWVTESAPFVVRLHHNRQGVLQWTFGLLAKHPYFESNGQYRNSTTIIQLLHDETNEIMKFVSDGATSMAASSRYPSYEISHQIFPSRWVFPGCAPDVLPHGHNPVMPCNWDCLTTINLR